MYLFGRSRRVNPAHTRAAFGVAVEAGSRASGIIGRPVFTWTSVLSAELGTVMWTARFDHLDELTAADDAVMADNEFGDWVEQNDSLFSGHTEDVVSQVIHNPPTGEPGAYVSIARGVAANGSLSEAMAMGIEIADTASRITGQQTMFVAAVTGPYGGVAWLTSVPDLGAIEAANETLSTNEEWLKLIDRAGHAYQPGVTSSILRRIG
jgi:hypothetical protein